MALVPLDKGDFRERVLPLPTPKLPSGFRMPAEWEPHEATWIAWPHNQDDWPGKFAPIPWVYVEIVRHLHQSEKVCILVQDLSMKKQIQGMLFHAGVNFEQVSFFHFPTDRVWIRDFGPIFVKNEQAGSAEITITNWGFNAWAKYPNWRKDNRIPAKVAKALNFQEWKPSVRVKQTQKFIVLEGGSIDVNGKGTLLTTEECLLSPIQQRNPGVTQANLEKVLHDYLGIRKVLWLRNGIAGDDTHGHVDDLARFVNPDTVVAAVEEDPKDANYHNLQENLNLLKSMTDQDGSPLKIVTLPMPRPVCFHGERLPASYANFYIANKVVLVPTFNSPPDRLALSTLAKLFPKHEVIGIHCLDLVWGLGSLHCLTQQQPR
jgi:agmatine deiminase